jgi:predicted hotdog family 3-hydroxylacyl-ACP dehydratase
VHAEFPLLLAHDHPALRGHFPGNPIVPGALLLDEVAAAVQRELGMRIREVSLAKFPAVLRPAVLCTVNVSERGDGTMRLVCSAGAQTVVTAVVTDSLDLDRRDAWPPAVPPRGESRRPSPVSQSSAEIAALLPHRGDMVLIDGVEDWSEGDIVCSANSHRRPQNPLRRSGALSAFCAIEYGAQAMAVHGALLGGGSVRPGLLASVRDVRLFADRIDDRSGSLAIRAVLMHRDPRAAVYGFSVGSSGEVLASGRVGIVMTSTSSAIV